MPINILTVTGEDFFIADDLMSLGEFMDREYSRNKDYITIELKKLNGDNYKTILFKDKIVLVRDISDRDTRALGYLK